MANRYTIIECSSLDTCPLEMKFFDLLCSNGISFYFCIDPEENFLFIFLTRKMYDCIFSTLFTTGIFTCGLCTRHSLDRMSFCLKIRKHADCITVFVILNDLHHSFNQFVVRYSTLYFPKLYRIEHKKLQWHKLGKLNDILSHLSKSPIYSL